MTDFDRLTTEELRELLKLRVYKAREIVQELKMLSLELEKRTVKNVESERV